MEQSAAKLPDGINNPNMIISGIYTNFDYHLGLKDEYLPSFGEERGTDPNARWQIWLGLAPGRSHPGNQSEEGIGCF